MNDKHIEESYRRRSGSGIYEKMIFSMGARLIDDFTRNISSVHVDYHSARTILSVYHFVQYHFVRIRLRLW